MIFYRCSLPDAYQYVDEIKKTSDEIDTSHESTCLQDLFEEAKNLPDLNFEKLEKEANLEINDLSEIEKIYNEEIPAKKNGISEKTNKRINRLKNTKPELEEE